MFQVLLLTATQMVKARKRFTFKSKQHAISAFSKGKLFFSYVLRDIRHVNVFKLKEGLRMLGLKPKHLLHMAYLGPSICEVHIKKQGNNALWLVCGKRRIYCNH